MQKKKSYKVKGSNIGQGKIQDHQRLTDFPKFTRTKDELNPQKKWIKDEYKTKKTETVREFVDMLEEKKNEDIGVY